MDRSATYDFLLMFHSNQGPISYYLQDKLQFQSKITNFSHPCILCLCWRDFPWNWVAMLGIKKTTMMGYQTEKEVLTISSAVWIQQTNVTDRRTPGDSKDALMHSIVW